MIKLTIDGKQVTVEDDATVLAAATAAGAEIPTLCAHESLKAYGACRMCTVQVEHRGKSKLLASCTLPAKDGMVVETASEKVLRIRRMLAELMLARCPQSKVIQDMAADMGVVASRFRQPTGRNNSTIVGDDGCILCGMCVRVCDDVLKIGALAFEGRGGQRRVTTPFGEPSDACLACGACSSICPTGAIEHHRIRKHVPELIRFDFEEGLATRKPVYIQFPQAVPRVPTIDADNCLHFKTDGCKVCEDNCEAQAIDHTQTDEVREIEIGSIIVATGFDLFDSKEVARYGYGRFDNVVNALEFERMCHAGGPTGGKVLTRDGRAPEAVAILHCIGSRDENHQEYCSRVCCMYSLKFAHLVKEKTDAEVYNCYIDMRAFGKGYEEFYKRVMGEGVHFIRGKCAEVTDVPEKPGETDKLVVVAEDTLLGVTRRLPVDMVILSGGLKPTSDADQIARTFSLNCANGGFFMERHPKLAPVDSMSDGIFLAGACQGPKDIPDAVAQGAAAAAGALSLIDKGEVAIQPITAEINEDRCAGCQLCIGNCPYAAIDYDAEKKVSVVTEELCKGCGTCVAGCPSGAARQRNFEDAQILSEIEGVLTEI